MSSACLSGAFRPSVARAPQVVREREILRVAASFEGRDGILEAENARKEVLTWIEGRAEEALPPEAWSCDGFDHRAGGRDCSVVRIAETTSDVWAIRANEPDGDVPQRIWTTEVVIGVTTKRKPLIGLRLIVSSPEEHLPIEPAIPSVLRQIQNKYDLYIENERLSTEPRTVESYEDVERLIGSLLDPKRRIPIVVLSVPPGAFDSYTPLLDPGAARARASRPRQGDRSSRPVHLAFDGTARQAFVRFRRSREDLSSRFYGGRRPVQSRSCPCRASVDPHTDETGVRPPPSGSFERQPAQIETGS